MFLMADRYGLGGRISSLFAQPVYAGIGFFIYGVMLAFYVAMYKPKVPRVVCVALAAAGSLLMFMTGSRGPVLALIPTIFAFVLFRQRRNLLARGRNALLLLAVVAGLAYTLASVDLLPGVKDYWERSFNLTSWESSGLSGRIDLTNTLLEAFKENPILGFGPGMIQKQAFAGSARFAGMAGLENHYAVILADGGLVAAAMYLLFIVGVYVLLIRRLTFEGGRANTYYSLMSLLLFTFLFANGLSASFLGGPIIDTMMAVLAIGVVGFETWKNQRPATASSTR
jgi:O-antigen ligase